MASLLIKDKWPVGVQLPDFFEILEHAQGKAFFKGISTNHHFRRYTNPIGIEVEVEGWKKSPAGLKFWENREDGSLKNAGREFVSSILSGILIDYALYELEDHITKHKKEFGIDWSHRTSIHVHVDLHDMPVSKLKWLIAYYALTEPLWYDLCHPKRLGNSFCFPLCSMNPREIEPGKNWPKYCGFNLGSSLCTFNTLEFRHMHGHDDFDLLRKWIKQILDFVKFIRKTPGLELRKRMQAYLSTGGITFQAAFGGSLPNDVSSKLYANAKWVADYLIGGIDVRAIRNAPQD